MDFETMELFKNWQFRQKGAGQWVSASVPDCAHIDLFSYKKIGVPFYQTNFYLENQ